jgi:multicomponent Na+:H+ antiporter subunit D
MGLTTPLPLIAVIIPVVGAALIGLVIKGDKARNAMAFLTSALTFSLVAYIATMAWSGQILEFRVFTFVRGHDFFFRVDGFSMLFAVTSSFLWNLATVYSMGYMAHEHNRRNYFTYFILSMSPTMGLAFSGNMVTMYLFLEFLAFATYPLVIHPRTREALDAGTKYIIYCLSGGALFLFATILLAALVPSLDFAKGGVLAPAVDRYQVLISIAFFGAVMGSATKAAVIPLHSWLPSAMVAPTPVSALLHAVAVVKAGLFGVLRVMFSVYGPDVLRELDLGYYLSFVMIFSILVASVLALKQTVLKRRLAYSTISQLGFITLGASLLSPAGVMGGLLHIMNHALMKITLFFCAGAIITLTGRDRIAQLHGAAKRLPLTMAAFAIGGLGLVGILPICGYITKYYILTGCFQAERPAVALVMLASSLLNSMYYLPIVMTAFFKKGEFERPEGLEAPPSMLVPTLILAAMCLAVGLFAHRITIPIVEKAIQAIM